MNIILNAKMKTICVNFFMLKFTFSVLSVQIVTFVKADETRYTTMYDNINYEQIMKNDRLLRFYVNCLLDKGPCTAEGRELKSKQFPICLRSLNFSLHYIGFVC